MRITGEIEQYSIPTVPCNQIKKNKTIHRLETGCKSENQGHKYVKINKVHCRTEIELKFLIPLIVLFLLFRTEETVRTHCNLYYDLLSYY